MENKTIEEVGIIVGRFQVPELHEGHISLLNHVIQKHKKVCIFLGVSPKKGGISNALDYHTRYVMFNELFKNNSNITISAIMDTKDDESWSSKLDDKIKEMYPGKTYKLYGSRDSFIKRYSGKYSTELLESEIYISGTAIREEIKDKVMSSYEFRCGIIYNANDSYNNAIPTVDIGLVDIKNKKILLGRKKDEHRFRLFGGFVDSSDISYESAAIRELKEEAGRNIEFGQLEYLMSFKIDDWRYRGDKQKIITTLYTVPYMWGTPNPGDDIFELKWFNMNTLKKSDVVEEHHILVGKVLERYTIPFDTDQFEV